jgi:hypothetical protein
MNGVDYIADNSQNYTDATNEATIKMFQTIKGQSNNWFGIFKVNAWTSSKWNL